METKNIDEVIIALRCSASSNHSNCEGCNYRVFEEIEQYEGLNVKPNATIDGIAGFESCDCDQIVLDAAQLLEQLKPVKRKKANYCSCWCDYPNKNHMKENGKWKCVDDYECDRQREGNRKTKCKLKEVIDE